MAHVSWHPFHMNSKNVHFQQLEVWISLKPAVCLDRGENLLRATGYLLNSIVERSRGGILTTC